VKKRFNYLLPVPEAQLMAGRCKLRKNNLENRALLNFHGWETAQPIKLGPCPMKCLPCWIHNYSTEAKYILPG